MPEIPSISVVIPLYNKSPYIARALNSILSQTFQDFEVIVVDDGSTDKGATIVKKFKDPRIRLILQDNQGVSVARNRGIEETRSELIAFLDADDEWLPNHLETLLRLWNRYPEAGAYGTAYLIKEKEFATAQIAPFSNEIPQKPWEGLLPSYFKSATLGYSPISSSTVAIPKSILIEMDGFISNEWWGEDTDLWGRIALKYPVAFSWDGMGIYHTESLNRASKKIELVLENIFVTSAHRAILAGKVPREFQEDLQEYIASKQIQTAGHNLDACRPDLARRILMNCETRNLWKSKYWTLFWTYVPSRIFIILKKIKSKVF
ncbi:MAG: glycosyltransferase family 2 protein [Methanomicrobiales archaeon HGW-Methanomicrobiales-1]|jgi:glycosyltransferase involved in cell wall biosynthesis|nr:MAG: glycosyltransferase family 2 protein [Methanomicrobiales archaeon HGW-Methanomicrobiales-1]